jgi:gamma-glutamyltranspeptidase / glutathione hydrolase
LPAADYHSIHDSSRALHIRYWGYQVAARDPSERARGRFFVLLELSFPRGLRRNAPAGRVRNDPNLVSEMTHCASKYLARYGCRVVIGTVLLGIVSCTLKSPQVADSVTQVRISPSAAGMVVTAMPLATHVGVLMLEHGGNAVDAAVAAAFALSVVEPSMSGLGGRTQILIRLPSGDFYGIDGTAEVPRLFDSSLMAGNITETGYGTVAVPGAVAGLAEALKRFGSMPLDVVIAPAIALAADGFPLSTGEAERLAEAAGGLSAFEGSRQAFLKPDGSPYQAGELLRQPQLARVLAAIAEEGPSAFYRGWIADAMARDIMDHGGFVARADLESYSALEMPIVRGTYRGYDLVANSFPASGPTVIQVFHMLEELDSQAMPGSPEWAGLVARALQVAVRDRAALQLGLAERAEILTSREWARRRAGLIGLPAAPTEPAPAEVALDNTTHLSVADGEGMFVALTQSLGPSFGSKVVSPGLGFVYAATLHRRLSDAESEFRRPILNQSPIMVLQNGQPEYVLGAAGGARILSSIVAVLARLMDERLSIAEAVSAPRFHPLADDRLELEDLPGSGWAEEDRRIFEALGFQLVPMQHFGRVHALHEDVSTRALIGVADPRWGGNAAAPRK